MPLVSPEELLEFWFGNGQEDRSALWFGSSAETDAICRSRFGDTWHAAVAGDVDAWKTAPRSNLAWVVLIDQLSRNLHRGTAAAFAHDALALEAAAAAVRRRDEAHLSPVERVFLYLPFEHSESLADQDECVRLFRGLLDAFPPEQRERAEMFLAFAEKHRDVIRQFGRYPHRNAVLGRTSTPEEIAYLEGGGARFGQ